MGLQYEIISDIRKHNYYLHISVDDDDPIVFQLFATEQPYGSQCWLRSTEIDSLTHSIERMLKDRSIQEMIIPREHMGFAKLKRVSATELQIHGTKGYYVCTETELKTMLEFIHQPRRYFNY